MEHKLSSVPKAFTDTTYIGNIPLDIKQSVDGTVKSFYDVELLRRMNEMRIALDTEIMSAETTQNCSLENRNYTFAVVDQDNYGTMGAYVKLTVNGDWEGNHQFVISRVHRGITWVTGAFNGKQKISLTFCEDQDSAMTFNSKEEAEYWLEINGITNITEFTIQIKGVLSRLR